MDCYDNGGWLCVCPTNANVPLLSLSYSQSVYLSPLNVDVKMCTSQTEE